MHTIHGRKGARGRAGRRAACAAALALLLVACVPEQAEREARLTLFIGVDVSGSFQRTGYFDDALAFTAYYIYGHLHGLGGLEKPGALFVGSIGGERPGEVKSFRPIHDFKGKSVEEIEADLRRWFRPNDAFTDFNPFFERVATFVKRQDLILKPISIVVISDGLPDVSRRTVGAGDARYRNIDLGPLEFLSRNVTVRLLYPSPTIAQRWEREIPRRRVRMWTVDHDVMAGWHHQLAPGMSPEEQDGLWNWIRENVDFRVRRRLI